MNQPCTSTTRRVAVIGAAVAIVAASSAFGIGGTTAVAAEEPTTSGTTTAVAAAEPTTSTATPAAPAATDGPAPTDAPDGQPGGTTPDPTPAPADESETPRPAASAPAPAATDDGSDLAFTEPSTQDAPLALTATAGTPFSHTFATTGGNGTVGYAIQDAPSKDYSVNVETGVLSGTPKQAGTFDFEVVALSGSTQITEYVELTVSPGDPVGVTFGVDIPDSDVSWQVDADGTIREYTPGGTGETVVSEVPATVGSSMTLAGLAVDALGNRTTPGDEYPRSTVTSTTASDGVVWDPKWSANTVTFSEPGTRTLTVSEGGVSTSFTVRVSEAPAPVAGIAVGVLPADETSGDRWGVEGDVITYYPADGDAQRVDAIPARQGDRVQIRALAVDADGQPVGDHTDLTFTSDVASDRIEYDPEAAATWVTFEHASPHTVTVASGDVTSTIRFEVQPTATTTVTTTHTPTASGTLAYTGADEAGPLAWALGLLASGAGLLVWRLRRRLG
ncbi:hypothetical protein [Curtobacterium sp. VKM Ac-2884]|uniref:hypothetical protein n=1 Tax=Curtobacterium sp. VKM Ac-2884 TaxID=2783818 RepID=UPI00188D76AD|nr:hypothetical protein [Curtobacterium sp. VKM Ac-2884]MBF4605400.1 hypothetical protein [Curtobacterium sp. VKM Ac-2884]